jgi:hypothetical protein
MYERLLPKAGSLFYEYAPEMQVKRDELGCLYVPGDHYVDPTTPYSYCPYQVEDCGSALAYDDIGYLATLKMVHLLWPDLYRARLSVHFDMSEVRGMAHEYSLSSDAWEGELPSNVPDAQFMDRVSDCSLWFCPDCIQLIHALQVPVLLEIV